MTRRSMTASAYGIVTSLVLILATALVMSTILKLTTVSEMSIQHAPLITSFIALFIGGTVAGAKMKERGLLTGALTGLVYSIIISLYLFLGKDMVPTMEQYLLYLINIAVTATGGVLGVNINARR